MSPSRRQPNDRVPVHFPQFRAYVQARETTNDDLMALLVAAGIAGDEVSRLSPGLLLADAKPLVPHVGRMNQRVAEVQTILGRAEHTIALIAIPYIVSVYSVYLADSVSLLRRSGLDKDRHEPHDTHLSELPGRIETATGEALPNRELELFNLIRIIRNRLAHQAGTPGSTLLQKWREISSDGETEWRRLAGRDLPDVVKDRATVMQLGVGELLATLAVTHRLAHQVNHLLAVSVSREIWADEVVADYRDLWPRRFGDRNRQLARVTGYAEKLYGPIGLDSADLSAAISRL